MINRVPSDPLKLTANNAQKSLPWLCSTPSEGYAEWSLRLLADKVVELGFCEQISHTEVRTILKKTNSNHT
jgi:hypothetical protein